MRMIRMARFSVLLVLALMSTQAFAWHKGYPFPTDLNIPLDDHHSLLVWFQNTPVIELDFTKHSFLHGDQSSDQFPAEGCVVSVKTISETSSLLVEQSVLNFPLPADVVADLHLSKDTKSLVMHMETDTSFVGQVVAHAVELNAVDSSGQTTRTLFQGTVPFDTDGPIAEIALGQEGKYLSNPALSCK